MRHLRINPQSSRHNPVMHDAVMHDAVMNDVTSLMPQTAFPYYAAPEAAGVSRTALESFISGLDATGIVHSALVARHGALVAEAYWAPYTAAMPQTCFSVAKTFTALAIGFAIADGKLAVTDRIVDILPVPDDVDISRSAVEHPAVSAQFSAPPHVEANGNSTPQFSVADITVRDVLMMATGHDKDLFHFDGRWGNPEDWATNFFRHPVAYEPGTHFVYNTGGTYWLSAIVQHVTGLPLLEYLQVKLFEPLGITGAVMQRSPSGVDVGGFGFNLPASGLLKLGQFILNKGKWNGVQLLPASWIEQMTSAQISNSPDGDGDPDSDWAQGYGYQMWVTRYGAVRADGAFGQFVIIWPKFDAVIVITAASNNLKELIQIVWDNLSDAFSEYSGFGDSAIFRHSSLPQNDGHGEPITFTDLQLPTPQGDNHGTYTITVNLPPVTPLDDCGYTVPPEFTAGYQNWYVNDQPLVRLEPKPELAALDTGSKVAAAFAWTATNVLEIRAVLLPTVFELTWVIELHDDGATITVTQNVAFADSLEIYREFFAPDQFKIT